MESNTIVSDGSSKSLSDTGQEMKGREEDSGYSTDSSPSTGNSSDSDVPSVFQYDASDEDDEDVGSRLEFLNQKQTIMMRAAEVLSREESYEAATALETSNAPPSRPSATWKEAMSVLRAMGHRSKSTCAWNRTAGKLNRGNYLRKRKSPKDPTIDFSNVECLPAAKFARLETVTTKDENILGLLSSFPPSIFHQGQWMAKALVWSSPLDSQDSEESSDCKWKVVSDPTTYSLGLVPPNGMSMKHAVDIQQAISISDEAHLVTQATPPFCVVYANKAFLKLASFGSTETIIGRPVESIIHVSQEILGSQSSDEESDSDNGYLDGVIRLTSAKACRFRISPVVDRARRSLDRATGSCMSHILIQVLEAPTVDSTSSTADKGEANLTMNAIQGRYDSEDEIVLLGTIG